MHRLFLIAALLAAATTYADTIACPCDPSKPETLAARQCSLCRVAENEPVDEAVFILKDSNPTKPGRWLALPRTHERSLELLAAEQRVALWAVAITKAKAQFGENWAVAYNSPSVQTQCHVHVHIGRLIPGVETSQFIIATKIEDIPTPVANEGFWIHPQGNLFHVHTGEQITETVLER